jgi:AcrR family transcriptional regulator
MSKDVRASKSDKERRAILGAAALVISEKGFARTRAADVASKAGISVDKLHEHFPHMGLCLRALSEKFVAEIQHVTDESTRPGIWKGAAARDVVEVAVRSILDVVIDRKDLVRAFLAQAASDPAYATDLRKIGTHLSKRLIGVLAECTNVPARPSRAVAFSLLLTVALAHHYVLVGDEWSGVSFSKEQLTEEAARVICAYLGLQPTIAFKESDDDADDLARTGVNEALRRSRA